MEPTACIERLLPYAAHRNPKVRGKVALVLVASVQRLPDDQLAGVCDVSALLKAAGALVTDNTPDARSAAKALLAKLHVAYAADPLAAAGTQHAKQAAVSSSNSGKENAASGLSKGSMSSKAGHAVAPTKAALECQNGGASAARAPCNWEAFCRSKLSTTAATAVLKATAA